MRLEEFHKLAGVRVLTESVHEEILKQLGGAGKLRAMIGAKDFVSGPDRLYFKWPGKRATGNGVRIILHGSDTYDVEFVWASGTKAPVGVKRLTGIYADQLRSVFEKQTGLYLSL